MGRLQSKRLSLAKLLFKLSYNKIVILASGDNPDSELPNSQTPQIIYPEILSSHFFFLFASALALFLTFFLSFYFFFLSEAVFNIIIYF